MERSQRRATWRVLKIVFTVGGFALAAAVVYGKRDEVLGAGDAIYHVRPGWVAVGVLLEISAVVAFAELQRTLLHAGGVRARLSRLTGVTVAGNALQNSLPGGGAWASVYAFRQFRRLGADDVLAGWMLVAISVLSAVGLAIVAVVGVAMAEADAVSADLLPAVALTVAFVIVSVLAVRRGVAGQILAKAVRLSQRLFKRPRGDVAAIIVKLQSRLEAVAPSRSSWAAGMTAALGNWVFDCAALAASFIAVHSLVPWRGLLLAYGAAQLAANLPITPGGLGVVEGSLTIALVAYGGAQRSTVAAVLMYRLLSFWGLIAVGWVTLGATALWQRTHPLDTAPDPHLQMEHAA